MKYYHRLTSVLQVIQSGTGNTNRDEQKYHISHMRIMHISTEMVIPGDTPYYVNGSISRRYFQYEMPWYKTIHCQNIIKTKIQYCYMRYQNLI